MKEIPELPGAVLRYRVCDAQRRTQALDLLLAVGAQDAVPSVGRIVALGLDLGLAVDHGDNTCFAGWPAGSGQQLVRWEGDEFRAVGSELKVAEERAGLRIAASLESRAS